MIGSTFAKSRRRWGALVLTVLAAVLPAKAEQPPTQYLPQATGRDERGVFYLPYTHKDRTVAKRQHDGRCVRVLLGDCDRNQDVVDLLGGFPLGTSMLRISRSIVDADAALRVDYTAAPKDTDSYFLLMFDSVFESGDEYKTLAITVFDRLTFDIKGSRGGEVCDLLLYDPRGERRVRRSIPHHLSSGRIEQHWQKAAIPLDTELQEVLSHKGLWALLIEFPQEGLHPDRTQGTVYVDNLVLESDRPSQALESLKNSGLVGANLGRAGEDGKTSFYASGPGYRAHSKDVRTLAFSPDGRFLVSGSSDQTMKYWSLKHFAVLWKRDAAHWVDHVAGSADGRFVASGVRDGTLSLLQADAGTYVRNFAVPRGFIESLAFSPDGKMLVSGHIFETLFWDASTGILCKTLKHGGPAKALSFDHRGQYLATGHDDGTVMVWSIPKGDLLTKRAAHAADWVSSVLFSPDGQFVVTASHDKTVKLLRMPDLSEIKTLKSHRRRVFGLAMDAAGRQLVSLGWDSVKLWTMPEATLVKTIEVYGATLSSVAISPDGRWLATGGGDGKIRLWSLPDLKLRAYLTDIDVCFDDAQLKQYQVVTPERRTILVTVPVEMDVPASSVSKTKIVHGVMSSPVPGGAGAGGGSRTIIIRH